MGKIKRKDNRFSITKEKAKRTWGTFCVTQMLAGPAGLTDTTLAPQPYGPDLGSTWTSVGRSWELSESQGYKETQLQNRSSWKRS